MLSCEEGEEREILEISKLFEHGIFMRKRLAAKKVCEGAVEKKM
jgi:hypothetical protein